MCCCFFLLFCVVGIVVWFVCWDWVCYMCVLLFVVWMVLCGWLVWGWLWLCVWLVCGCCLGWVIFWLVCVFWVVWWCCELLFGWLWLFWWCCLVNMFVVFWLCIVLWIVWLWDLNWELFFGKLKCVVDMCGVVDVWFGCENCMNFWKMLWECWFMFVCKWKISSVYF